MTSNVQRKKIALWSAVALSATSMIGSGWLFSAQLAARLAGQWAFAAWMLAAVLVILVALSISRVVMAFPVRGAITRSSSLSHNNVFGMPFAFANWFGMMVTIATEAQATTQYLSAAIKSTALIGPAGLTVQGKLLALGILFMYLMINFWGIKLLARINNVVTILKVFTPLFTIAVLLIAHFDHSNFTMIEVNQHYGWNSALAAIVGAGLIYSYNGFQLPAAFASEIENPKRNVALAMVISIVIVMGLYMALEYTFMGAVPHQLLVEKGWAGLNFSSPLVNLAMLLGLNFLVILLMADSVVSPSGTGYSYLGACSRMLYAMAAEGQMPRFIAKLSPKHNFSKRSMLINWILAAIVLWNSANWAALMVVVTGYHIIGYMAAPISMSAIDGRTKIPGLILFVILGLLMTTITPHDLLVMNISLTALVFIYMLIQFKKGSSLADLLLLAFPFLIYLWLIYAITPLWVNVVLSLILFSVVTSKRYVQFCKNDRFVESQIGMEEQESGNSVH